MFSRWHSSYYSHCCDLYPGYRPDKIRLKTPLLNLGVSPQPLDYQQTLFYAFYRSPLLFCSHSSQLATVSVHFHSLSVYPSYIRLIKSLIYLSMVGESFLTSSFSNFLFPLANYTFDFLSSDLITLFSASDPNRDEVDCWSSATLTPSCCVVVVLMDVC